MERAKVLQEIRNMRFQELYDRWQGDRLTQEEAAEILGVDARGRGSQSSVCHCRDD